MAKPHFNIAAIHQAGGALAAQDQEREDAIERERDRAERARVELDKITDRASSTRELNQEHVQSLAASIAAIDLIQPIAVDRHLRLLAGGHRVAALKYLRTVDRDAYEKWFKDGVPVRRYAFDADTDPNLALGVEVAENEHRRDYSKDEIGALVGRLKKAGYKDTAGRPKAGEKALAPALQVVLGKSLRTVRRILAGDPEPKPRTHEHALAALRRSIVSFLDATSSTRREDIAGVRAKAKELEGKIERVLAD